MAPEPMPRTRMLHPDQNHARNKHPGSQQPCEIYRLLLQTQQTEMIEYDRSDHLVPGSRGAKHFTGLGIGNHLNA